MWRIGIGWSKPAGGENRAARLAAAPLSGQTQTRPKPVASVFEAASRYHSAGQSQSSQAVSARWSMGSQTGTQRSFTPPRQYSTAT